LDRGWIDGVRDSCANVREGLCRRRAPGEDLGGSFDEASGQCDGFDRVALGERSWVVLSGRLEAKQLRELSCGRAPVVSGLGQEIDGLVVFTAGPLTDQGTRKGIAGADPSGHSAAGRDVPATGLEVLLGGFRPC